MRVITIKWYVIGLIIIIVVSSVGCLDLTNEKKGINKIIHDYDKQTHKFKSYDPGNNISVKDKVDKIWYDPEMDRTLIVFESKKTKPLAFTGKETNDLTSNYFVKPGDTITVDLHIYRFSNGEETLKEWMY